MLLRVRTEDRSLLSLFLTWSFFGISFLKVSFVSLFERFLKVLIKTKLIGSPSYFIHQLEKVASIYFYQHMDNLAKPTKMRARFLVPASSFTETIWVGVRLYSTLRMQSSTVTKGDQFIYFLFVHRRFLSLQISSHEHSGVKSERRVWKIYFITPPFPLTISGIKFSFFFFFFFSRSHVPRYFDSLEDTLGTL